MTVSLDTRPPPEPDSENRLVMANSPSGESAIQRFVRVLETFTPARAAQSASEIGRHAGLPSSTAHRIIAELVDTGLLERDEDRRIRVGLRLWELTTRSSQPLWLRQAALPFMEDIQAKIGEHTQLVVLEGDDALCVERLSARGAGENVTLIAGRLPLHASSSGLVLLAYGRPQFRERILAGSLKAVGPHAETDPGRLRRLLAEIRRTGHVIADGTVSAASTGVAVPLRAPAGEVIAALSVILPRGADPSLALGELQRASRGITRRLDSDQ